MELKFSGTICLAAPFPGAHLPVWTRVGQWVPRSGRSSGRLPHAQAGNADIPWDFLKKTGAESPFLAEEDKREEAGDGLRSC